MNQPVRILITLLAACLVLFGWLWLEGRTGRSGAAQPFPGETVLLAAYPEESACFVLIFSAHPSVRFNWMNFLCIHGVLLGNSERDYAGTAAVRRPFFLENCEYFLD